MRQHWNTRSNRAGEKETFWVTMLALAIAIGSALLVFSMVGR